MTPTRHTPATRGAALTLLLTALTGCSSMAPPTNGLTQTQIDQELAAITRDLNTHPGLHTDGLHYNPGGPLEPSVIWGAVGVPPGADFNAACDLIMQRVWKSAIPNQILDVVIGDGLTTPDPTSTRDGLDCSLYFGQKDMKVLYTKRYGPRPTRPPAPAAPATT